MLALIDAPPGSGRRWRGRHGQACQSAKRSPAECGTATPGRDSLNSWFCAARDAELKAADYQPGDEVAKLRRDNEHLQRINRDNARLMKNMRQRLKRLEAKHQSAD